jgi:membrane fusion protein (multidrug efflux system)
VVQAGTPLVTISDLSRIKLDFTVPETQLSALVGRPGDRGVRPRPSRARPSAAASPTDRPGDRPASRAVMVRAILPNPGTPAQAGHAAVGAHPPRGTAGRRVPELAAIGNGEERAVFVLGPGNVARSVTVTTGPPRRRVDRGARPAARRAGDHRRRAQGDRRHGGAIARAHDGERRQREVDKS